MTETTLAIGELEQLVEEILRKGGLSPLHAGAVTRVIVAGERDACKSHGVYRIEGCLRTIKAGKVVPDAEPALTSDGTAIVRVDARGGFANAAFELGATQLLVGGLDEDLHHDQGAEHGPAGLNELSHRRCLPVMWAVASRSHGMRPRLILSTRPAPRSLACRGAAPAVSWVSVVRRSGNSASGPTLPSPWQPAGRTVTA